MKQKPAKQDNIFIRIKKTFQKPSNKHDIILGQLLKKKNLITEAQIQDALKVQRGKLYKLGKAVPLGQIIAELGYVSEESILQAINENYDISAVSLSENIHKLIKEKRGTFVERLPSPRLPIWLKLSLTMITLITLTVVSLSSVILGRQKKQLYNKTLNIGKVELNYFAKNAGIPLLEDDILQLNSLITQVAKVDELVYVAIVDKNNNIKAHSDPNKIGKPFINYKAMEAETMKDGSIYFTYTLLSGERVINISRPVVLNKKVLGTVHVGLSIDFIQKTININRMSVIILGIFVIFISILISVFLGLRFSRPVQKLVLATQKIGEGNYKYKIDMKRNDELGNLAKAFNQMGEDLMNKSLMQESFGKYVGCEVLKMILANPEKAWLKGRKNEATIVFADIRGFTSYSAAKEPEDIVEGLNQYFEIISRVIINHGGYVDKFIGDAVLSVFGVPVYHKDHVRRAVEAAVDIQTELIRASSNKRYELLSSVGIGIDTGTVISGNIGSQLKIEYTVIGNSVNVASHINELAGRGEIVISKRVYEQLEGTITVEALPPQKIKGKSEKVETYRVLKIN